MNQQWMGFNRDGMFDTAPVLAYQLNAMMGAGAVYEELLAKWLKGCTVF
jgi:hypothetical protein